MRVRAMSVAAVATGAMAAVVWSQGRGNPTEWPTAYGDAQHTSWVRADPHISIEAMGQPGFQLQWKTTLESPARQGVSLTQGVVVAGVNLFTPVSALAGPSNRIFALDNDTGNLFWSRRFEGPLAAGSAACPGGISGAPTRIANLVAAASGPGRRGGGRGGRAYSGAVGEPGAGVPIPAAGGRGGGGAAGAPGRGAAAPAAPTAAAPAAPAPPLPPSPFPTNAAAVATAGGPGGNLFRPSGVFYAVSADGMFRTLGFVSGKDVARPAPFLPAGARFSDLIGVGDMVYTATSQGCGGAPNAIWAMNTSGDSKTVVSWKTNGGSPIGSVVFATSGTVIAAIGPSPITSPGASAEARYANAIVALDPRTLALKDWFTQPGVEFVAAPIVFQEGGKDIVAATTKDGRIVLLDAASLGGTNHGTPLFASSPLTGASTFAAQSPAMWQERPAADAPAPGDGTRWLLVPVAGPLPGGSGAAANGNVSTGAVLAVKVSQQGGTFSVQPGWVSENIASPLTPIVVNAVVFAASGQGDAPATLYGLNGVTGQTMWQSGTTMTSPLSGRSLWTGSGHVFAGTRDGTVYAFGFAMERK